MEIKKYTFQMHGDERGQLVVLEKDKEIPFEIKRVYYIYDVKENVKRGFHAHKSLEQVLVCVHGTCKILLDNGKEKEIVLLNNPNEGLFISNHIWREMFDFSSDAVLVVFASELYDEKDYIRDYKEFLEYVEKQKF
ncbi:MAG: FdtA/QdtA family cupin domain-containing protein [Eubacteriales bacterium]|nr:FdtA/QdtA family cupin domain-containing protein [Eubacteriales bacterium]